MRRYPVNHRNEGTLFTPERDNRTNLWYCKREPRIQIYADVWKGADDHENRAYLCVHESKKTCKDQKRMGITDGVIEPFFLFCPEKERKKQKRQSSFVKYMVFQKLLCLQSEADSL